MNQFKKILEDQTPISHSQKQHVKTKVLSQKNKKRNTGVIPMIASFMFVVVVIVGSFILLDADSSQIETSTAPNSEFTTIYDVFIGYGEPLSVTGMHQWNQDLYYYDDREQGFQQRNFNIYATSVTGAERLEIGELVGVPNGEQKTPTTVSIGNIIATPDDQVKIENGQLYINDKPFEQYYFAGMDAATFEGKGEELPNIHLTEEVHLDTLDYLIASYDWMNSPILIVEDATELYKIEHMQRSSTDEREQVVNYLETGDEQHLVGISPEMILSTYLFTIKSDGSKTPEVKALSLKEFDIAWQYDLTYHEEKFQEMLQYVPASIYQGTASMHIKGWDIPFVTVEFQKNNGVWKISKIE